MLKLLVELLKATGEDKQKRKEDDDAFHIRIVKAMHEMEDDDWDYLSEEAQDWFNVAAEAANKKEQLPPIPGEKGKDGDTKKERKKVKDKKGKKSDDPSEGLEEGLEVVIYGKKDKVLAEGEVTEVGKKQVTVLQDDEEEKSVSLSRMVRYEVIDGGSEEGSPADGEGEEGEEIEVDDIEVGQSVRLVLDDEDVEGEVEKVKKKVIVIDGNKHKKDDIDEAYLLTTEEADPESTEPGEGEEIEVDDIEVGQEVQLVIDDDEIEGIVEKVTKKAIVIDGDKHKKDDIDEAYLFASEKDAVDGESIEATDVEKGMAVSIEMKSGDVIEGNVKRVASKNGEVKTIFVDDTRCAVSKIVSINSTSSESEPEDAGDETTDSVRDIICKFPKMKLEKIVAKVSKAKIDIEEDALEDVFNDTHTIIEMLKEHGKLA